MNLLKLYKKPYVYFIIGIFLIYITALFLISGFYNTIPLIIIYAKTLNWFKIGISIFLSLTIGILVAMNSVLLYIKYKQRAACKKGATLTGVGVVGGFAAGVCPLCVTGLFPIILALFGVSFSFASLPFQGLEIQVIVLILLAISLKILNRKV